MARAEYKALHEINDPVTGARAYNPGDEVMAGVVDNWKLVAGEDVEPSGLKLLEKPAKNASRAVWAAYAVDQGHAQEDVDGMGRDEIAALFEEKTEDGTAAGPE